MKLTYDPIKRQKTLDERGLDFADAAHIFTSVHFSKLDLRKDYGEERIITVGTCDGTVIILVWTPRENTRRIISMRKADEDERQAYSKQLD